jgi:uncharacterized protein YjiK
MNFLKFSGGLAVATFIAIFVLAGCKQRVRVLKSPPNYDFKVVDEKKLDLRLKEISGIVWDAKNDRFATHNDESGYLFFLNKEGILIEGMEKKIGQKGSDFEDVALVDSTIYMLRSDGLVIKIITDSTGRTYGVEAGKIELSGAKDFEAMYYDESRKALIVICKNCAIDDKTVVSAFAFFPDSIGFAEKPIFTINADKVRELSPKKTSKLQPSAAAIHPVLKKLFIISSASNQLVIADLDGNVEGVYVLAQKLFPQPEGITFNNKGDMYISNESIASKGTLLKFLYQK